jgi:uracil-DNA glycosylase
VTATRRRAPPQRAGVAPRSEPFDPQCERCPRLAAYLAQARREHPDYYARPVAPFGDAQPRLLVAGLAPGFHGANRTGRPFTGDHAGVLLYQTLYDYGFASRPQSTSRDDGLVLHGCRIANAVNCVPPANKPTPAEVRNCNGYLRAQLDTLAPGGVILALGRTAHDAVLMALGLRRSAHVFAHGAEHPLADGRLLLDSYHCSRYNTQTKRLTEAMFRAVFAQARRHLDV